MKFISKGSNFKHKIYHFQYIFFVIIISMVKEIQIICKRYILVYPVTVIVTVAVALKKIKRYENETLC